MLRCELSSKDRTHYPVHNEREKHSIVQCLASHLLINAFTLPLRHGQDMLHADFFMQIKASLNSVFLLFYWLSNKA